MTLLRSCLVALAVAAIALPGSASAKDHPEFAGFKAKGLDALMTEADRRLTNFKDEYMKNRMEARSGGETTRTVELEMYTKGSDRRALRFQQPADLRGMGVVIKGTDEIYVRLPDSRKVRRLAAHARKQNMQGTDYAFDDTSLIRLMPTFKPTKILGETDTHIEIEMVRRAGKQVGYTRVEVKVDRAQIVVDELKYFDGDKAIKIETRWNEQIDAEGGVIHMSSKMKSLEKDHETEITVLERKVNIGVKEKTFSKRWLVRGL
jgi:hypothetical protein